MIIIETLTSELFAIDKQFSTSDIQCMVKLGLFINVDGIYFENPIVVSDSNDYNEYKEYFIENTEAEIFIPPAQIKKIYILPNKYNYSLNNNKDQKEISELDVHVVYGPDVKLIKKYTLLAGQ